MPLSTPEGTGNSPPARNSAAWPDIAVRVGSASVRTAPRRSSALQVALSEKPPPATLALMPLSLATPRGAAERLCVERCRGRQPPAVSRHVEIDAELLDRFARTSATVTFSMTCWRAATVITLATLASPPANWPAIATALAMSSPRLSRSRRGRRADRPSSSMASTLMREPGRRRASVAVSDGGLSERCGHDRLRARRWSRRRASRKKILVPPLRDALDDGAALGAHDRAGDAGLRDDDFAARRRADRRSATC